MNTQREYEAFISYKQNPTDTKVAKDVQRLIERYSIPKDIRERTGRKKLRHVFRDVTELTGTKDLSPDIEEALKRSDFLIVICSKRTSQSLWVVPEIEMFLKYHDRDHILTVLVDGEPLEVIPEILLKEEIRIVGEDGTERVEEKRLFPLSCDYRDGFRKAKHEEIHRLVARFLDCSYDDLYKRAARYRIKRNTLVLSFAFFIALGFGLYNFHMNQEINKEHQGMLNSESNRLTDCAKNETNGLDLPILLAKKACSYKKNDEVEDSEALLAYRSATMRKQVTYDREYLMPVSEIVFSTTNIELGESLLDGRFLSCCAGTETYLYEIANGKEVFCCKGDKVFFSPDASWCVVSGRREGNNITIGLTIPDGNEIFTHSKEMTGGNATLYDEVIFDTDGKKAFIISEGIKESNWITEAATDGELTTLSYVPEFLEETNAVYPLTRLYEMRNRTPRAIQENEKTLASNGQYESKWGDTLVSDDIWDKLEDEGLNVLDSQQFSDWNLKLYQCCSMLDERYLTYLYSIDDEICYSCVPGRAFFDENNECVYSIDHEMISIYTLNNNYRGTLEYGDSLLFSAISDDAELCSFIYIKGSLDDWAYGRDIDLRLIIQSMKEQEVLLDKELYHDSLNSEVYCCYVNDLQSKVFYLDIDEMFQLYDVENRKTLLSWKAEDASNVTALYFDEEEEILLIGKKDNEDYYPIVEVRSMHDGELLHVYDYFDQINLRYNCERIQSLRLMDQKLLIGIRGQSILLDYSGKEGIENAVVFDYTCGNCSEPYNWDTAKDGLVFFTSGEVGKVATGLFGIYDIERDAVLKPVEYARYYAYDEETGILACQSSGSESQLSQQIQVFKRNSETGEFSKLRDIEPEYPDMTLRGGMNCLSQGCILLENDSDSLVYRIDDGVLLLHIPGTGYMLKDGLVYDTKQGGNFGKAYDCYSTYEEVEDVAEMLLSLTGTERFFTEEEMERYYIYE